MPTTVPEPVTIAATVQALAVAVMALLIGTGTVTAEVGGYVLGIVAALIVLIGLVVRGRVTPTVPPAPGV